MAEITLHSEEISPPFEADLDEVAEGTCNGIPFWIYRHGLNLYLFRVGGPWQRIQIVELADALMAQAERSPE